MIPPPPDKYAKRGIRCTLDGFQVGEDGPHRYTRVLALIPLVWSGLQRARTGIYAVCESTSTAAAQTVRGAPVVRVEPCPPGSSAGGRAHPLLTCPGPSTRSTPPACSWGRRSAPLIRGSAVACPDSPRTGPVLCCHGTTGPRTGLSTSRPSFGAPAVSPTAVVRASDRGITAGQRLCVRSGEFPGQGLYNPMCNPATWTQGRSCRRPAALCGAGDHGAFPRSP